MKDKHVNEDVEIVLVPGSTKTACAAVDRKKIQRLIKDKLLLTSMEPYHKVQVEVVRGADGCPAALVATMLRANTYTADIVKVNVDADYNVKSIETA